MTEKIQKLLSDFGYGSRRFIEMLINHGDIYINGKKAIIGQRLSKIDPGKIIIQGKIAILTKKTYASKILLYNKPEGEICTRYDFQKRKTVFNTLPILKNNRWISIGRLDLNTQGLLLFTNNGNLAYKLMHPKYKIEREYYIRVFGDINQNKINILKNGVKIHNKYSSFKKIEILNNTQTKKNIWLKVILCQGRNREIRLMLTAVQCQVNRLIRIRYGNIILPKSLKKGDWIELHSTLVNNLHNLVIN
ncbi:pseudouridine synthase [Buchnera aphidicola]|uniref:pseudouridine synthase n=1 Tax=Buchnera aphidicola TaxID=9 RepID=UPI003BEF0FEF